MKKMIAASISTSLFILISFSACCQQGYHKTPAWVSDNGYWVVEKNLHTPRQCTVRFYNNANTLIGVKKITGLKLKLNRKKTKFQLKSMLEAELLQWASTQKSEKSNLVKKQ